MRKANLYAETQRKYEDEVMCPLMWKHALHERLEWDELLALMASEIR